MKKPKIEPRDEHVPIPVEIAKHIAESFYKDIVVIVAIDNVNGLVYGATYGVKAHEKEEADRLGKACAEVAGAIPDHPNTKVFEDFHRDPDGSMPGLYREACELLESSVSGWSFLPETRTKIEDFLKRAKRG